MPMYEMSLQIGDGERLYFVVLADDEDDASERMRSTIQFIDHEGAEAIGIVDGPEWSHGTVLQFSAPSVGYFETDG